LVDIFNKYILIFAFQKNEDSIEMKTIAAVRSKIDSLSAEYFPDCAEVNEGELSESEIKEHSEYWLGPSSSSPSKA